MNEETSYLYHCKQASAMTVLAVTAMCAVLTGCGGTSDAAPSENAPSAAGAKREQVLALSPERGLVAKAMTEAGWSFTQVNAASLANYPQALVYIDVTSPAFASSDVRSALTKHPGRILFDSHDRYDMPVVAVGDDGRVTLATNASTDEPQWKTAEELADDLFHEAAISIALTELLGTGTAATAVLAYGNALVPLRVAPDGSIDGDTPQGRLGSDRTFIVESQAFDKGQSMKAKVAAADPRPSNSDLTTSRQVYMYSDSRIHNEMRWGSNTSISGAAWCVNSDGECQRIVQAFVNASSGVSNNGMLSKEGIKPLPDETSCRTYRIGTLQQNGLPIGTMQHTPDRLLCTSNVGTLRVKDGSTILAGPYADYFSVATEIRFSDSKPCARLVAMTPKPQDIPLTDDKEEIYASGYSIGGSLGGALLTAPLFPGTAGAFFSAAYVNTVATTKVTRFWDVKDQSGGVKKCGGSSNYSTPGATSRISLFRKTDDRMLSGTQIPSTGPDYYWTEIVRRVEERMPAMSIYGWGSDHEARYEVNYNGTTSKNAMVIGKIGLGLEYIQIKGKRGLGNARSGKVGPVFGLVEQTSGYNMPPFVTPKLAFELWGSATWPYRQNR